MTVRPYVGSKSPPGTRSRRWWFVAVEKVLELEQEGAAARQPVPLYFVREGFAGTSTFPTG